MPFMPPFRPAIPINVVRVKPLSYGPGAGGGLAYTFKNPTGGVHIFMPPVIGVDHRPAAPPPVPTRPAFQPPKLEIPPIFHAPPPTSPPSALPHPPSPPPRPTTPPRFIAPLPHHFTPPPTHYSPPAIPRIFGPPPAPSKSSTESRWHVTWPWHRDKRPVTGEGARWREIYERIKADPNPYSGLPERTDFESSVKKGGGRDGYKPIWDPSKLPSAEDETLPSPIGYSQTFVGGTRYFDIEGNLVGTSEIPIESDDISPIDFIPFQAIGSLAASGGKLIGTKMLATVLKYAGKEAGLEGSEVFAKYVAKEGGVGASEVFAKYMKFVRDEAGGLRLPGTKLPAEMEVGEQVLDEIARSKEPKVIRDMSVQMVEALKQKYGPGLAYGLHEKGTVMSYEAASAATEGLNAAYQGHHIAEVKVLKLLGQETQVSPAVILTTKEHAEISALLEKYVPKGEIEHMTKAEIFEGYRKAYQGHPVWLDEVKNYFPGVR